MSHSSAFDDIVDPIPIAPVKIEGAPAVRKVDQAAARANLEGLGFSTDLEKTFECTSDAHAFIRQKLFLQSKGSAARLSYTRFVCSDRSCPFQIREYVNAGGESLIQVAPDDVWHATACGRKEKRAHGVPAHLRTAALKHGPRKVLEEEAKAIRAQNNDSGLGDDAPIVLQATREQLRSVRRYAAKTTAAEYQKSPSKYLEAKFPGSKVHVGTYEGANVVCGVRTITEMLAHDLICIDATYKIAPLNGNVATIGFTRWDSFVPVFFAVSEPMEGTEKCEETAGAYAYLVKVFADWVIEQAPTWKPRVAVRDMACQISNGLRMVYEDCEDLICFFHVMQALEAWLQSKEKEMTLTSLSEHSSNSCD